MDPRPAARDSVAPSNTPVGLSSLVCEMGIMAKASVYVGTVCVCCSPSEKPTPRQQDRHSAGPGPLLATGDLSRPRCLHVENGNQPGVGPTGPDEVSKPGLRNLDHTPP